MVPLLPSIPGQVQAVIILTQDGKGDSKAQELPVESTNMHNIHMHMVHHYP